RSATAPHLRRAGPLRLELYRPADGSASRARPRADRRPLPLRTAVMAWQFPESGHRPRARGICRRLRRAVRLGALLHAGERDVRLRADERARPLVARAAARVSAL